MTQEAPETPPAPENRADSALALLTDPDKELDWIRTMLNVPSESHGIVPWVPTPQQIRISEVTQRVRRLVIVKGRQTRCSTLLMAKAIRRSGYTYGQNFVIICQNDDMVQSFRTFIKDRLNDLRHALNDPEAYSTDPKLGGLDNDERLRFGKRQNTFYFASAEAKVGLRGIQTAHWVHASEVAHWPDGNARKIIGGLDPACPPNGTFIMESTPNGAAGLFYDTVGKSRPFVEVSRWTTQFFPWWIEPAYTMSNPDFELSLSDIGLEPDKLRMDFRPNASEETLMNREGLDVNQMLWRRFKSQELLSTGQYFAQEYPEDLLSCWLAAGVGFFHDDQFDHLAYIRDHISDPKQKVRELTYRDPTTGALSQIDFLGANLYVWEGPLVGHSYTIFADISAGVTVDGDFSAVEVIDNATKTQVAECRVRTLPSRVGAMTAAMGAMYNWAFVGVERNTYGQSALEKLQELHYPNLYYDVINQPTHPELGWFTGPGARDMMLNRFRGVVFDNQIHINSRMAALEMGGFTWKKVQGRTGNVQFRAEASSGLNDDTVIALAGACVIAPYAPNRVRLGPVTVGGGYGSGSGIDPQERLDGIVVDGNGIVVRQQRSGGLPWLS